MNYSEIKFTKEEICKLIENRTAICNYIMQEVIPYMRKGERIKINYGGEFKGSTAYHFYIYEEPEWFCKDSSCGIPERNIRIGYSNGFGHVKDFETERFPYAIIPVIDNWRMLKKEISNNIKKSKNVTDMINCFYV